LYNAYGIVLIVDIIIIYLNILMLSLNNTIDILLYIYPGKIR